MFRENYAICPNEREARQRLVALAIELGFEPCGPRSAEHNLVVSPKLATLPMHSRWRGRGCCCFECEEKHEHPLATSGKSLEWIREEEEMIIQEQERGERAVRAKLLKYKKAGWNKAKIDRWLSQKIESEARDEPNKATTYLGQLEQWKKLLETASDELSISPVGALAVARRGIESIPKIDKIEQIPRSNISIETLSMMRKNVPYIFV